MWSFGVVLWEMATLAEQPYQGWSNDEVRYHSDDTDPVFKEEEKKNISMNLPVQLILSSLCIVDRLSTFYKHWRSVLGARLFFQFAPRHLLNHCTTAAFFTAKLAPPRHIQGGKSCTIQNIIKSGKFVILLAFNNSKFYLGNP